jgi:hypothetical protein
MTIKFFFFSTILFSTLFFVGVYAANAQQYGLKETAQEAGLTTGGDNVTILAGRVVGTALSLIGVLFFILMIYGGFTWMTARGNEQQTEKAKTTITAAVIGMIIVLASYAITNFVFQAVVSGGGYCTHTFDVAQASTCIQGGETCQYDQSGCEAQPQCCVWVIQ